MLFSSPVFLFFFLPVVLLGYYLIWTKARNYFLLLASLVFFAWGGVSYASLILISITFNFLFGKGIGLTRENGKSRIFLIVGVTVNLLFLGVFKYADFIIENLNLMSDVLNFKPIKDPGIVLPVGISFYTFQAMSYLIDVYRRETEVQHNPFNLGLYIALFPQLIAGPIVRYHDIANQINERTHDISGFSYGLRRFILGLGKKVLLANNMGAIADIAFGTSIDQLSGSLAWLGLITYALQIYLDFSGYSDMAIGLGKMFGFTFLENFNYPYISRSIKEFWRRWHISLSTWFRDYLYIPIGGSRISKWRTYLNLLLVFFVTGLWHGASWSFVLWGFVHGFFLIIERLSGERFPGVLWRPLQHTYTLFVALMAWVLFRADTISYAWDYYGVLFGSSSASPDLIVYNMILNKDFLLFFALSIMSASGLLALLGNRIDKLTLSLQENYVFVAETMRMVKGIGLLLILAVCAMYLITNTYNPFIYYRF
ncbi:MAG: MBOAT family protein [Bacteroidales bacterium]|nr:MBOAT family protein [Bacteroidales bacterium]